MLKEGGHGGDVGIDVGAACQGALRDEAEDDREHELGQGCRSGCNEGCGGIAAWTQGLGAPQGSPRLSPLRADQAIARQPRIGTAWVRSEIHTLDDPHRARSCRRQKKRPGLGAGPGHPEPRRERTRTPRTSH